MIVVPFNKETEEKPNGRMVTLHRDCDIDDLDSFEKREFERMRELD